jgi:hypothetical protein
VPDAAAAAFLAALPSLELQLAARVASEEAQHAAQKQKSVAGEIRRAFRRVALLPEYELVPVRAPASAAPDADPLRAADVGADAGADAYARGARLEGAEPAAAVADGAPLGASADGAGLESAAERDARDERARPALEEESDGHLFPPGPVARLRLTPTRLRVAPGAQRTLRAAALDGDGRPADPDLAWTWRLEGPGELDWLRGEARYLAPPEPSTARIVVRATSGSAAAEAAIEVEVLAELAGAERAAGIPEPTAIYAPNESWRSRLSGPSWQYNSGHRDYLAVEDVEARRLRYLVHLFAKEVVLKNFGTPGDAHLLERMVEVLTHLDTDRRAGAKG